MTLHALVPPRNPGGLQARLLTPQGRKETGTTKPQDQGLEGGLVVLRGHVTLGLPLFPSPFRGDIRELE